MGKSLKRSLLLAIDKTEGLAAALPGGLHSRRAVFKLISTGVDRSKTPVALLEMPDLINPETLDGGRSGIYHTNDAKITVSSCLSLAALSDNSLTTRQREQEREDAHDAAVEALKVALLAAVPEGWTLERLFINSTSEELGSMEGEESKDLFFIESVISFGVRATVAQ